MRALRALRTLLTLLTAHTARIAHAAHTAHTAHAARAERTLLALGVNCSHRAQSLPCAHCAQYAHTAHNGRRTGTVPACDRGYMRRITFLNVTGSGRATPRVYGLKGTHARKFSSRIPAAGRLAAAALYASDKK